MFKRNADPQPFRERDFLDFRFLYDNDSKLALHTECEFSFIWTLTKLKFHFDKCNAQGQRCGFDFVYYMVFLV